MVTKIEEVGLDWTETITTFNFDETNYNATG